MMNCILFLLNDNVESKLLKSLDGGTRLQVLQYPFTLKHDESPAAPLLKRVLTEAKRVTQLFIGG